MAKKRKVKRPLTLLGKIFAYPILAINFVFGVLLATSAYLSLLPPVGGLPLLSLSGLAFPILFCINLVFLIIWTVIRSKYALLPLFFAMVTIVPAFNVCPFHIGKTGTDADITLVSYNTHYFGAYNTNDFSSNNEVLQYSCSLGADIICYQEANQSVINEAGKDKIISKTYPYNVSVNREGLACLSRYPIISHEIVNFDDVNGNRCMIMKILVGADTITVFNCHFQSNHLDPNDFEAAHQNDVIEGGKRVLRKLLNSTSLRAKQAETIAGMAVRTPGKVIIAGDFNDSPLSYTHHRFYRHFTDCYIKTGNGPGVSYNRHHLYYRIDHVFCNSLLKPASCRIDRGCGLSDHYPIVATFTVND